MSNDIVQVQINIDNVGVSRPGYGMPLIVSHNATFPDRIRFYSAVSEATEADFASDSPEALMLTAFFSQSPKPPTVAIGRADGAKPTKRYSIKVPASPGAKSAYAYVIEVKGEGVTETDATYTSDSAATIAEVHNGIVTALNAVTGKNYTAAFAALTFADREFVAEADDETITTCDALVNPDDVFTAEADTEVFTAVAHGLLTGDGPFQVSNGGGALPTGLTAATDYWVIRIDADTFYLATSLANALAGTNLSISDDGTGTQTIADTASTKRVYAHTLQTGDGPFQVSNSGGALPAGLVAATDYWVIRTGTYTFKFASTLANALAGTAVALTTDGTGTQTMADTVATLSPTAAFTVTGDAPGDWFSLALASDDVRGARLEIHENHDSPAGLSDELDAILDEDDSFYQVHTMYNSEPYCTDVADWTELNERTYVAAFNETDMLNVAVGSGTDFGAEALDAAYTGTAGIYARDPSQMASARWMGRWLPTDPGQATAALKTLVGLDTEALTGTQRTNLKNRRMQTYRRIYGRGVVTEGMVYSTIYRFLDVRRDVHWFIDELKRGGFELLAGSDKVPYTPNGFAKVEGMLRGKAILAEAQGVFGEKTTAVEMPEFEDVEDADKAIRTVRNARISGTLAGAVHSLIPILGTISF